MAGQTRGYAAELCVHLEKRVEELEAKQLTLSEISLLIEALLYSKDHDEQVLELMRSKNFPGNHPAVEVFDKSVRQKIDLMEKLERLRD